ncbi:MAG: flagellin [Proteobacteria bacterium]|jgi:flagellin|nr:flagellin [Pseudomonadota bacterium]
MAVVNTNISASLAQASLAKNERALSKAMEQLSTGRKINTAADDAAGLAISTRMSSQIIGLEQSIQNASDAISMIQTAESALDEMTNMLLRMRELALQASNGTGSVADRNYLQDEFTRLQDEIDRIANNTEWNGRAVLNGNAGGTDVQSVSFQVGGNAGQTISVDFGYMVGGGLAVGASGGAPASGGVALSGIAISGATTAAAQTAASAAMTAIDLAIENISNQRASFGATVNQLTHSIDNLTQVSINAESTRSRIMDTDYARSTSELAKAQIIQQAGTAMLAQANQLPASVLDLLK